ncbi:hypothetical protein TBLA_0B07000 [Henningerozyma blattae CBS 6284]|uniref:Zn(2)-C6 fungal-type domain-containing protein n=1 Tax=Henningerozyma blattae (strain ATCC 34711 / CBS 6284 / DSM 70876 / NBRC 10599 / NRRL Y-10934 / UCD 77-7) TaxID=1071380 RepID=I2GZG8_HENB6|nr:hypothetical protein TBLA_0B07000 [Tetrapisispora blattae CBS 6284]CCH59520.1 hypothetical protein TBLA_0B07000 [Tetrapisispora blattae CBS 6284]
MSFLSTVNQNNKACIECVRQKLRCDKRVPCSNCIMAKNPEKCAVPNLETENASTAGEDWSNYLRNFVYPKIIEPTMENSSSPLSLDERLILLEETSLKISPDRANELVDFAIEKLSPELSSVLIPSPRHLYNLLDLFFNHDEEDDDTILPQDESLLWATWALALRLEDDKNTELYKDCMECSISKLYSSDVFINLKLQTVQVSIILSLAGLSLWKPMAYQSLIALSIKYWELVQPKNGSKLNSIIRGTYSSYKPLWNQLAIQTHLIIGPTYRIAISLNDISMTDDEDESEIDMYNWLHSKLIFILYQLRVWTETPISSRIRQLDVLLTELDSIESSFNNWQKLNSKMGISISSKYEKIIIILLLNYTYWKAFNLHFILFDSKESKDKMFHYTNVLIELFYLVKSDDELMYISRNSYFFKIFVILNEFYGFIDDFDEGVTIEETKGNNYSDKNIKIELQGLIQELIPLYYNS